MKKSNLAEDQQRMQLFQNQMKQMTQDYEYMKRNKEEAKKQLDARFQDIQRKIQNSKDFIASQGKRINDTLLAFQHKFDHELKSTKQNFDNKLKQQKNETDQHLAKTNSDVTNLTNKLNQQKLQRSKQFQENARETKEKLDKLFEMVQNEKNTRVERENFILGKLGDEVFKMNESLKYQKDERNLKLKELRDFTTQELQSQTKYNVQFHEKNFKQFSTVVSNLENEMNIRFSNKDQIINSLSKIVRTMQDTLRHPN